MLENTVKAIMESPSVARLEGFPLDIVQNYLSSLHNETEGFVNLLDGFEYEIECHEGKRTLTIGAQLDNLLVDSVSRVTRFMHGRGQDDPKNYTKLAMTMGADARKALRGAEVDYISIITCIEGLKYTDNQPFSNSFIGTITQEDEAPRFGALRKETPILLVPHDTAPEIGKVVHSIIRNGHTKREIMTESAYEMAMESLILSSEQALGYLS